MNINQARVLCAAVLVMALWPAVKAADNGNDQMFVKDAAMGNMFEVATGKVAMKNASGASARDFAARMVTDHSKANAELTELAAKKNWTIPSALDEKHMKEVDKFAKLNGAAFDKAYLNDMKDDHEKDVKSVKDALPKLNDPDLKSWAEKTLSTMEEHLKSVDELVKTVK